MSPLKALLHAKPDVLEQSFSKGQPSEGEWPLVEKDCEQGFLGQLTQTWVERVKNHSGFRSPNL